MMEPQHPPHKPYAGGKPFPVEVASTITFTDWGANALLELRENGGVDTDGKGASDLVNERRYVEGLLALYLPNYDFSSIQRNTIVNHCLTRAAQKGANEARF